MLMTPAPRPQIALFNADPEELGKLAAADAVDWLICRHQAGRRYEFRRGEHIVSVLDLNDAVLELPDLVAILGIADPAIFADLAEAWRAALPSAAVALEWVGAADQAAILRHALQHACSGLLTQRAQCGRMALDLASYRREFDIMQQKFAALEAYVSDTLLSAVREVFSTPASGATLRLDAAATPAMNSVRQLLPVDSLGVAGLWMGIAAVPGPAGQLLKVSLTAIETDERFAEWSLDPGWTAAGWRHLVLGRAIDEAALSLILTVSCAANGTGVAAHSAGGDAWSLLLGPPNPYPQYRAGASGTLPGGADGSLQAPLALRIEAALPGTRPPVTTASVLAEGAPRPQTCRLTDAVFDSVTEMVADQTEPAGSLVHHDREFHFIQVHPRGGGRVTAARLVIPAPAGTWRLSAAIHLAHEEANPASFAMLARPLGDGDMPAAALASAESLPGFSGWSSLSALERGSISTILPDHQGHGLIVYLLTRQADAPTFAWARFTDLRLHHLPSTPAYNRKQAVLF